MDKFKAAFIIPSRTQSEVEAIKAPDSRVTSKRNSVDLGQKNIPLADFDKEPENRQSETKSPERKKMKKKTWAASLLKRKSQDENHDLNVSVQSVAPERRSILKDSKKEKKKGGPGPSLIPAVIKADSKWRVAKKVNFLGKMNLFNKFLLNQNYGIDESTEDKEDGPGRIYSIMPTNKYVQYWKKLVTLCSFYLCLYYVYKIAILEFEDGWNVAFDVAVQSIFLCDLILNFFIAYIEEDETIRDLRHIAIHYIMGYFFFDLFSAIPVNLVYLFKTVELGTQQYRMALFIPCLRALRFMIEILRFEDWKDFKFVAKRSPTVIRLAKILIFMIYFVHFAACIFILIANVDGTSSNWMFKNHQMDESPFEKYIYAAYWATYTLMTIGFGNVILRTNTERLFAILIYLVGSSVYAFMISNLAALIQEADKSETNIKLKIHHFNNLAKAVDLPEDLVQKTKKFIETSNKQQLHHSGGNSDDNPFLEELPYTLKSQILININAKVVDHIQFLKDKDVDFILRISPHLKPIELLPKEVLYRENDTPEDLAFLTNGTIHYKGKAGAPIYIVHEGEMVGDIEILFNTTRIATAQAQTRCSLYIIDKDKFMEIMGDFEPIKNGLLTEAGEKREKIVEKKGGDHDRFNDSGSAKIISGSNTKKFANNIGDYANRIYTKPTDKFDIEVAHYIERGVGKKYKKMYLDYQKKEFEKQAEKDPNLSSQNLMRREKMKAVRRESFESNDSDFSIVTRRASLLKNKVPKKSTVDTPFHRELTEEEIIAKRKDELKAMFFEKTTKVKTQCLNGFDIFENNDSKIQQYQDKCETLQLLIKAVEEKQLKIAKKIEDMLDKTETSDGRGS